MIKRLPPKLLLLSVLISIAFHYGIATPQFISFPFTFGGILLVVAGWMLTAWSGRVIEAHGTALHCQKKPTALVTAGPFGLSRNPFYLGYLAITIGVAIMLGSVGSFIGPFVFIVAINIWVIPGEESRLKEIFGTEYEHYRHKVRRWM